MLIVIRCWVASLVLFGQSALASQFAPKPGHPAPVVAAATRPVPRPALAAMPRPDESPQVVALTGVVLRADGQPQPGVAVYLAGAPRELVVTDATGTFRLPAVPKGKPVTLLADYFGLGSSRVVVSNPSYEPLRIVLGQ